MPVPVTPRAPLFPQAQTDQLVAAVEKCRLPDDLRQDVWLDLARMGQRGTPFAAVAGLVPTVVKRKRALHLRHGYRDKARRAKQERLHAEGVERLLGAVPDPARGMADREGRELVRAALRALPGRQRVAVVGVICHGRQKRHVAARLGCSVYCLNLLLRDAVAALRASLKSLDGA